MVVEWVVRIDTEDCITFTSQTSSHMHVKCAMILLILCSANAVGQSLSGPADLVKSYFNNTLPNFKSALIGEAVGQHYNPKELGRDVTRDFELLEETDSSAVVAVTLKAGERFSNVYVFLRKQKEWMIKSFRGLWLPPDFYGLLEEFKDLDSAGIVVKYEDIILDAMAENPDMTEAAVTAEIGTAQHFLTEIFSMRLMVSPDADLVAHFRENKPTFEHVLTSLETDKTIPETGPWKVTADDPFWKPQLDAILISHISGNGLNTGRINFTIGGATDNTVGYFFCSEKKHLPQMSDQRYIMIRHLGDGWYVYKTT